jgi:hypothetical protein
MNYSYHRPNQSNMQIFHFSHSSETSIEKPKILQDHFPPFDDMDSSEMVSGRSALEISFLTDREFNLFVFIGGSPVLYAPWTMQFEHTLFPILITYLSERWILLTKKMRM